MVTAQLPPTVEEYVGLDRDAQPLITVPRPSVGVEEDPVSHQAGPPPSEGALTRTRARALEPERGTRTAAGADVREWGVKTAMGGGQMWTGAAVAVGTAATRRRLLPPPRLVIDRHARALLTSKVKGLIEPLLAIAQTQAFRWHLHVTSMVVRPFLDPDDDSRELVLEIYVSALPSQALAYWDGLGIAVNSFRDVLPASTAGILGDRLSVHVVWPSADGNGV